MVEKHMEIDRRAKRAVVCARKSSFEIINIVDININVNININIDIAKNCSPTLLDGAVFNGDYLSHDSDA